MSIRVSCGINEVVCEMAGRRVRDIRNALATTLSIATDAKPFINGSAVPNEDVQVQGGQHLDFQKVSSVKSFCDSHRPLEHAQPGNETLLEAEDSLHKLEDSIRSVQQAWPVASAETNGPANGGPSPKVQPRPVSDLMDILHRCENLSGEAHQVVESAWELLDADKIPDWDEFGRNVLDLLTRQTAAIAEAASLVQRDENGAIPLRAAGTLRELHSSAAGRTRDFLDSWPWSTGNKPGDEEDAAAARKALEALPSFDVLWRLAREYPPPPGWLDEE